ncbi:MAG: GNAT family N-acetyltransferase [Syntrophorhabdaceae bacterium]|nr:GNAT family N-acetyltransferase [Syntrophorhabdaceae bacterium]
MKGEKNRMNSSDYTIDLFRPEDGEGVAELFREVYGEEYPVKIVYNPEQLSIGVERGDYVPFVARTKGNRIVGFSSLYHSAPYKGIYEVGLSLVAPDYRNTPIFGLLSRQIIKVAPTTPGLEVLFLEAVCNHTITQKAGIMFKLIDTTIEIDLMPAEAYENEQSASGRVSTLNMFRTFVHKPHIVYVPEVYRECIRYIYDGFDDSRTILPSTEPLPADGLTKMSTEIFDFAQLARVAIHEVGANFEAAFDKEEKHINDRHCQVIQVWLNLSWPWVGEIISILRARGFFLGGILPSWFGEDGLLMQKVLSKPNWEGINLYTDRAKHILSFIRDEWEENAKR